MFLKETVGTLLVVNGVVFKSATKLPRSQLEFDRYVMGEKKKHQNGNSRFIVGEGRVYMGVMHIPLLYFQNYLMFHFFTKYISTLII